MVLNNHMKKHQAMGGGWLGLGYPRSANSWMRYIVKACRKEEEVSVHFTDDHHDFYIKRHWVNTCPYYNSAPRGIVLLLRNYKEVIIRHNKMETDDPDFRFYQSLERMPNSLADPAVSYIHPIHLYDNWDCGPKHIVYYEDLMEKPRETIQDLGSVMGFDTEEFLANYDYHKNRSVQAYDREEGAWTRGGTKEYAYKDDITSEQKKEWDSHLRENFPYLFETFLKRYADE